ncbi:MAG: hydrogenase maturation peptidase HycI [Candidatus Omnitrophica bacterium]|nr:hydrogenase maturation peptidase HycI [Candidatus Omnitrophota bacterium]
MQILIQGLKTRLKAAKRIAILGVGSQLRGDDAAGILVADALSKKICKKNNLKVFFGHTAPENLTGEIKKFKPEHLIIIDSADMGKKVGEVSLIDLNNLSGVTFSTHQLPVEIMADYLMQATGCQISIIGIQPKQLKFDSKVSQEILRSVKQLAIGLQQVLGA